jgi:biotin carboxylase
MKVLLLYPFAPAKLHKFVAACRSHAWELTLLAARSCPVPVVADGCAVLHTDDITEDPAVIAGALGDRRFEAIVPFSELSVVVAERLCARLGHPHNALDHIAGYRNKAAMRAVLAAAGAAQPRVLGLIRSAADPLLAAPEQLAYPVIVKPVDCMGGVHVTLARNGGELRAAVDAILAHTHWAELGAPLAGQALIEEAVSGPEYSAEVLVAGGEVVFQVDTRKIVSALPDCDEVGHIIPAGLHDAERRAVRATVDKVIAGFGYRMGAMHLEYKLVGGVPVVIEVGFRIAGDRISDLIERKFGIDLEAGLIRIRAGERLAAGDFPDPRSPDYLGIKFLFPGDAAAAPPGAITVVESRAKDTRPPPGWQRRPTSAMHRAGHLVCASADLAALAAFLEYHA